MDIRGSITNQRAAFILMKKSFILQVTNAKAFQAQVQAFEAIPLERLDVLVRVELRREVVEDWDGVEQQEVGQEAVELVRHVVGS